MQLKRRRTVVTRNVSSAKQPEHAEVTTADLWAELDQFINGETLLTDLRSCPHETDEPLPTHSDGSPCMGMRGCPFLVVGKDQSWTCSHTGLTFGQVTVDDGSTSYKRRRSDITEDMSEAPVSSSRRQRDPVAASMSAFLLARSIENEDDAASPSTASIDPTFSSSASPSVAKAAKPERIGDPTKPKRLSKNSLSAASNRRVVPRQASLLSDATSVLDEVIRVGYAMHRRNHGCSDDSVETKVIAPQPPTESNIDVMTIAVVRRYIKECQGRNEPPSMHDLHSICYGLRKQVAKQHSSATISSNCARRQWWYLRVRDSIARLAVSLWRNMLRTPYMLTNRRSHDGFKQFVVGVTYGLRRGVVLSSGVVLIPQCDHICNALPNMRSPRDKRAKHAPFKMSAHRGLCTFHRAMASVDVREQDAFWSETARIAKDLQDAHDNYAVDE